MTEPSYNVLVPREPTEAMLEAGSAQYDECTEGGAPPAGCVAKHVWRAMLDAVPDQPRAERERVGCPFCGAPDPVLNPTDAAPGMHALRDRGPYYLSCEGCGADGPACDTSADAETGWNRRAPAILRDAAPVVDREGVREEFLSLVADAKRWESEFDGDTDGEGATVTWETVTIVVDGRSIDDLCDALKVPRAFTETGFDALTRAANEPAFLPRERQEVGGGLSGFSQEPVAEHPIWAEVGDCLACDGEPEVSATGGGEQWRCFHCDEVFTSRECATRHFGRFEDCQPTCKIGVEQFRKMEVELESWRSESDPATLR